MLPIAILAGGLASRLGTLTIDTPKCLLSIEGKPFLVWQLTLLKEAGYTEFVLCLSHLADQVQKVIGDGSEFGVKVQYSFDGVGQVGTGGAIARALSLLGPKFAVIYGDSYLPVDFCAIEDEFLRNDQIAMMTVYKNFGMFDKSNADIDSAGFVKYNKTQSEDNFGYIDYGLNYFSADAFLNYTTTPKFDLSDVLSDLSYQGKLRGVEVFQRFYEVGSSQGISDFTEYLRRK